MSKKILTSLCVMVLLVVCGIGLVGCKSNYKQEFEYDKVLIVLTKEATMSMYDYTAEDFVEAGISKVYDLTAALWPEYVRALTDVPLPGDRPVNIETFRRIFTLILAEPSRRNVLNAVAILSHRDDLESAGLSWFGEFLEGGKK